MNEGKTLFPFVRRKRYEALRKTADDLYSLVVQHHAINVMEGFRLGCDCPVCVKDGHSRLHEITKGYPWT